MPRWLSAVLVVAVFLLLAGGLYALRGSVSNPLTASQTSPEPVLVAASCHSDGVLPDPHCTPGVTDTRVTPDNIQTTICVSGYTSTVRPPPSYTDSLKKRQIKQYGYADTNPADYEEDHLIPLELGGHPSDPGNLWPEPKPGATKKDEIENALHAKVCAGTMNLRDAQAAIALNWETAG
ncbi:MAG TPA: hypothetical protein VJR46_01475 [Candidatus Dormibacteraeota bacterium]|nr:hypothetical protein [Candidatus Dormibacteraeota bacterium]